MSSGVDVDIPKTFGALLIGAVFASLCVTFFLDLEQGGNVHPSLSGGITVQTLVYFKLYPSDGSNVKTLVRITRLVSCIPGLNAPMNFWLSGYCIMVPPHLTQNGQTHLIITGSWTPVIQLLSGARNGNTLSGYMGRRKRLTTFQRVWINPIFYCCFLTLLVLGHWP